MLTLNHLKIVYEDPAVIVIDKPEGLLTMATATERSKTAYALLRQCLNSKRPPEHLFIVHRLDREASGLLVFAKSVEAKEYLQDQFKAHTAGRRYVAVVEGSIKENDFTIRTYLTENAAYRVYSTKNIKVGKLAVTHVHVVKRTAKHTLVEVKLETGRKHQIRVHLAERGHPIVGDKNYGSRTNPIRRLALHGAHLDFRHPITGKLMHFDSPPPTSFSRVAASS